MGWIIIGIIIFLITMYVHKHTYTDIQYNCKTSTYEYYEADRMPFPIWLLILLFAVSFVPILNIILFIIGLIVYSIGIYDEEIYFVPTGVIKKILNFLNKKV